MSGAATSDDPVRFQVRFAPPSADLAPYLGGFYRYDTSVIPGSTHEEVFLPSWGHIRMLNPGAQWSMKIDQTIFSPIPRLALFGPTAHAGTSPIVDGQLFGVSLSPRGWARLIRKSACPLADRIVPFDGLLPALARELATDTASDLSFEDQTAHFQSVLQERIEATRPEPEEVGLIEAILLDSDIVTVAEAQDAAAMPDWKFTRFVRQHFGFPPKLLMRRARFMRTILKIRATNNTSWANLVDPAYSDQSHFIRDCHDFMGMTPGQFSARFQPLAHAAFDAREKALGNRHHLLKDGRADDDD